MKKTLSLLLLAAAFVLSTAAANHPRLFVTEQRLERVRSGLAVPESHYAQAFDALRARVESEDIDQFDATENNWNFGSDRGSNWVAKTHRWDIAEVDEWVEVNPESISSGDEVNLRASDLEEVQGLGVWASWPLNERWAKVDQLHLYSRDLVRRTK